jgi:hypothetical protein
MGSVVKEDFQIIPSKYAPTAMFFMLIMPLLEKVFTNHTTTAALQIKSAHKKCQTNSHLLSHSILIRSHCEF